MSVIVDYSYYTDEYQGTEADEASFPTLFAHASRMIGMITRWQVDENTIDNFPSLIRTMYRLAVCSQIDFLALNGLESLQGANETGFTVGKVTVQGKGNAGAGGALSSGISPAAKGYLEQTGLMNPQIGTCGDIGGYRGVSGC